MTGDDMRALSVAATPGPWTPGMSGNETLIAAGLCGPIVIVGVDLAREDAELIVWLRNHADALADLIDAAHLVLPDFDGGVAYKLGTDNLRALGNALLALDADA